MSDSPTSTASSASQCLHELHQDLLRAKDAQGECTLAYWRLADATIHRALSDFGSAPDWKSMDGSVTAEVQSLFHQLNQAMAQQEETLRFTSSSSSSGETSSLTTMSNDDSWSVVFGGKFAPIPRSISEQLVHRLVSRASLASRVYTVSRTPSSSNVALPAMITHIDKQKLTTQGSNDFEQVMQQVLEDWRSVPANDKLNARPPITFYFTLGQHKGPDHPFQQNIHAATNFAHALTKTFTAAAAASSNIPKWRVVLTGTDATLPSTTVDPVVMIQNVSTKIPSYKILEYNFVYAASKLCQYYTVAIAIANMMASTGMSIPALQLDKGESIWDASHIVDRLTAHVMAAGDNVSYQPPQEQQQSSGIHITMSDLDAISQHWMDAVQPAIQEYLWVAPDISICYTPLHRDPWIQAAFEHCHADSNSSPKAYVMQQIVQRLKNAISIDRAAQLHCPPPRLSPIPALMDPSMPPLCNMFNGKM